MDGRRKLAAVIARLGPPRDQAPKKGEYGFLCPGKPGSGGCSSAPQGKVRLWVNPDLDSFHCWHCNYSGGSLASLMVRGSEEQREYIAEREDAPRREIAVKPPCTSLPDGFQPFRLSGSRAEAPYLSYLRGRGISDRTLKVYRMGFVDEGRLAGRVVVPSFDRFGMVNFWSARSIYPTETLYRYRLPDASKNVISNEHMVDWARPVYLVEGIFDEIAIGANAIALYGKFMQTSLAVRLVERNPPMINICLDADARQDATELMKRLLGYDLPCTLVDLKSKDPGSSEPGEVSQIASATAPTTGSIDLLRGRLGRL